MEPGGKYEKGKDELFKQTKTTTEGDEDYLIHTDNDQHPNNEESKDRDQREERTKYNLELDH